MSHHSPERRGFLRAHHILPELPPYEYVNKFEKSPNFNFQRSPDTEREGKKLHKYYIDLPLDQKIGEFLHLDSTDINYNVLVKDAFKLDMQAVTLTVWSEKELELTDMPSLRDALQYKKTGNLTTFFGSGYLASSEQLDKKMTSFVENLSTELHAASPKALFNNIIIGFSCPGFDGTETVHEPNKRSIGVESYARLMQALVVTLGPDKINLLGHSAGGAGVLQFIHELKYLTTHEEIEAQKNNPLWGHIKNILNKVDLKPVALNPALNSKPSWQFLVMKDLNQIKYAIHLDSKHIDIKKENFIKKYPPLKFLRNIPDDIWTLIVVRMALGYKNPFVKGPPEMEEEAVMHCKILESHAHAGKAKLDDLFVPHEAGQRTLVSTPILTGSLDRITPLKQILSGLGIEVRGRIRQKKINALNDSRLNITILRAHHDDFCFNPQTAGEYARYIAAKTIHNLVPTL